MQTIDQALNRLEKSKFRSSFFLDDKDRRYVEQKGRDTIRRHAEDFIRDRLAPAFPKSDGSQTPTKGHPVFKAQHACGCCCRNCLEKWYKVKKGKELTDIQQKKIVDLLMAWIERQISMQHTSGAEKGQSDSLSVNASTGVGRPEKPAGLLGCTRLSVRRDAKMRRSS